MLVEWLATTITTTSSIKLMVTGSHQWFSGMDWNSLTQQPLLDTVKSWLQVSLTLPWAPSPMEHLVKVLQQTEMPMMIQLTPELFLETPTLTGKIWRSPSYQWMITQIRQTQPKLELKLRSLITLIWMKQITITVIILMLTSITVLLRIKTQLLGTSCRSRDLFIQSILTQVPTTSWSQPPLE